MMLEMRGEKIENEVIVGFSVYFPCMMTPMITRTVEVSSERGELVRTLAASAVRTVTTSELFCVTRREIWTDRDMDYRVGTALSVRTGTNMYMTSRNEQRNGWMDSTDCPCVRTSFFVQD
jgi:hypothetical protein